jgi:hypothetical protein
MIDQRKIAQKALAAHSVPMTMRLWNKLNRQRQQLSKEQLSGLRAIGVNQARTAQSLGREL